MLSGIAPYTPIIAADDGLYGFLLLIILILVVAVFVLAYLNSKLKNANVAAYHEAQQVRNQQANASSSRDDIMFEQHRQMNELTINKLKAEAEWMASQTAARAKDQLRDEAWLEYHELMVEKAKLEIDSLRLYIQEQRKRLNDDWNH